MNEKQFFLFKTSLQCTKKWNKRAKLQAIIEGNLQQCKHKVEGLKGGRRLLKAIVEGDC